MLIKPLVIYNVHYFFNNFKNNLRTLSDGFLTEYPENKNIISLNPEINVLICRCLLYFVYKVKHSRPNWPIYSCRRLTPVSVT